MVHVRAAEVCPRIKPPVLLVQLLVTFLLTIRDRPNATEGHLCTRVSVFRYLTPDFSDETHLTVRADLLLDQGYPHPVTTDW